MEFVLAFQQRPGAPANPQAGLAWKTYMGAMAEAGVLRAARQLDVSSSLIVGCEPAAASPAHAPSSVFQLGGYALIEVATLKEALAWAERSPSNQSGCTQVLPVLPLPPVPPMPTTSGQAAAGAA